MELKVKNIVYFIIMCKLHAISFILVKFVINTYKIYNKHTHINVHTHLFLGKPIVKHLSAHNGCLYGIFGNKWDLVF